MTDGGEECPPDAGRPRWLDWVERSAAPKRFDYRRPKRKLTRWQKRGPMQRRDWVRFYKWAAKNAVARHMRKPAKPPAKVDPREQRRKRLTKKVPLEDRLKRTPELAEPRWPRDKFEAPDEPDWPFQPQIRYKGPTPVPEKGRPRVVTRVPREFQHIELEMEYWATLRFPIHPSTKSYRPTKNIRKLAVPRITPPLIPHCPIPEVPPEIIPKRRKFTPHQWKQHKAKLMTYLAKPRRLFNEDDMVYMAQLRQLRCERERKCCDI